MIREDDRDVQEQNQIVIFKVAFQVESEKGDGRNPGDAHGAPGEPDPVHDHQESDLLKPDGDQGEEDSFEAKGGQGNGGAESTRDDPRQGEGQQERKMKTSGQDGRRISADAVKSGMSKGE
jgi:hypothetical protein